jgi:pSer/pThr/pTyr-binding forkhead associated (FHA) protein
LVGYLQLPDGRKVEVSDGLILGRMSSSGVVVKDTKASRRHARLIVMGPVVEIEDLGSSNGTLLNDKPVKRRMLRDGDVVQIGTTRITYREPDISMTRTVTDLRRPTEAQMGAQAGMDDLAPGEDLSADQPDADPDPAPGSAPSPSADADVDVLEFADDDVVQVPKARRPDRPRPASAASQIPDVSMSKTIVIPKKDRGRFLSGGRPSAMMVGDDLRQMSVSMRLVSLVVALVIAGVLGYLAYRLVS